MSTASRTACVAVPEPSVPTTIEPNIRCLPRPRPPGIAGKGSASNFVAPAYRASVACVSAVATRGRPLRESDGRARAWCCVRVGRLAAAGPSRSRRCVRACAREETEICAAGAPGGRRVARSRLAQNSLRNLQGFSVNALINDRDDRYIDHTEPEQGVFRTEHAASTKSGAGSRHRNVEGVRSGAAGDDTERGTRVLVVDDEENIAEVVTMALRFEGFNVRAASSGRDALAAIASFKPHIVVLDVMLPDIEGFEVARRLGAQRASVPIIFLTARDATEDKIRGLTGGGDDYMTKPFSLEELVARIRTILRRTGAAAPDSNVLSFEDLELDEETREVTRAGNAIDL